MVGFGGVTTSFERDPASRWSMCEIGKEAVLGYPCSPDTFRTSDIQRPRPSRWLAQVYEYPDGSSEAVLTPVNDPDHVKGSNRPIPRSKEESEAFHVADESARASKRAAEYEQRSVSRAATAVRRLVRSHNATRLLTFTNGGSRGWLSRRETLDDVSRFLKVHGATFFGESSGVLVVAERGGRNGRWHAHALVSLPGRVPYTRLIQTWTLFLSNRGHESSSRYHRVHVGEPNGRYAQGFRSARHAAGYAAKYLAKGFDAGARKGENRYRIWRMGRVRPVHRFRSTGLYSTLFYLGCLEVGRPLSWLVPIMSGVGDLRQFRGWRIDRDQWRPPGSVPFDSDVSASCDADWWDTYGAFFMEWEIDWSNPHPKTGECVLRPYIYAAVRNHGGWDLTPRGTSVSSSLIDAIRASNDEAGVKIWQRVQDWRLVSTS